jgi:hypothetical protein
MTVGQVSEHAAIHADTQNVHCMTAGNCLALCCCCGAVQVINMDMTNQLAKLVEQHGPTAAESVTALVRPQRNTASQHPDGIVHCDASRLQHNWDMANAVVASHNSRQHMPS